jgi:hypothetical protein
VLDWLDDGSGTPATPNEHFYSTLTLAQGAIEELFSSDAEVDQYFEAKAVAQLVSASGTPIANSKQNLRVAEGLDATV